MKNDVLTNNARLLETLGEKAVRESQKQAIRGLMILCCGYRAAMYKLFDAGVKLAEGPSPTNTKGQVDEDTQRALSCVLTIAEDLFGSDTESIVNAMTEELNPLLKTCGIEIIKDDKPWSSDSRPATEDDMKQLLEDFEPDTEGN